MGESQNEATGAIAETTTKANETDNSQSKENIFDNRQNHKKIIRVVTVMAYLFSVSFVAIALSGYYVFIWRPPNRGSTSRARTMSQAQAQYFAENSVAESPIINNTNTITHIHNEMDNFKNKISQRGGINILLNESLELNERIINSTSALVDPISTQIYQNKTDKVTIDTQLDIYGILNGRPDLPIETKNLETSTWFIRMSNENSSVTTTDFPFSTNWIIENKRINLPNHFNSIENQHINKDQVLNDNKTSFSDQQKLDAFNQTVTAAPTVDLIGLIQSTTQGNAIHVAWKK